jgi:hypothetical protein
MASIKYDKTTNGKHVVRANGREWAFDTHEEAQIKANEEMWKEYERKHPAQSEADKVAIAYKKAGIL